MYLEETIKTKFNNITHNAMKNRLTLIIVSLILCFTAAFAQSTYKVKSGDTLSGIAKKYGVTVDALKKANPSLGKILHIGQQLTIPAKANTSKTQNNSQTQKSSTSQKITATKEKEQETANTDVSKSIINHSSEADTPSQSESKRESELKMGDLMFQYFDSNHVFSMNLTLDLKHYQYLNIIAASSFGETQYYYFGYGAKKRYVISDLVMLSGHLGPYMGVSCYTTHGVEAKHGKQQKTSDYHVDFAYGLSTEFKAGIQIFKGSYLTLGYYTGAPKFKFNHFIKDGSWAVGISGEF